MQHAYGTYGREQARSLTRHNVHAQPVEASCAEGDEAQ